MLGPAILSVHREAVLSSDAKDTSYESELLGPFKCVKFFYCVLYQRFHCMLTAVGIALDEKTPSLTTQVLSYASLFMRLISIVPFPHFFISISHFSFPHSYF